MTEPGGKAAAVVVPKSVKRSRLYQVLENGRMPPNGRLPQEDLKTIHDWIAAGCPSEDPTAVWGAAVFQKWGYALCGWAVLNLIALGVLCPGALRLGESLVAISQIPILGVAATAFLWYPTDVVTYWALVTTAVGLAVGGSRIASDGRKSRLAGAICGMLAPVGLFVLVRRRRAAVVVESRE